MLVGGESDVNQLMNKGKKALLTNKKPRVEKTTEEKFKEIDAMENMINDPKKYEQISTILKWFTSDGKDVLTVNPNIIKERFQEAVKLKRMKAQLTSEQKASIKKVNHRRKVIVGVKRI